MRKLDDQIRVGASFNCAHHPIGTIKSALSDVVTELNALVGQPVEVILASVDGTVEVTVQELGQIVAGLITVGSFCALRVGLANNAF